MFNRGFDGSYGTHPLDKYDTQAQEPEYSGFQCANCVDELQLGAEVWAYENATYGEDYVCCSISCLGKFSTDSKIPMDYFEWVTIEKMA